MKLIYQPLNHQRSLGRKGTQPRGTTCHPTCPRSQNRIERKSIGLHGVREAARKDSSLRFVNLLHHVSCELLEEAFFDLKKPAAVGADGVTWHDYERNLEDNIVDLHGRIHRGGYRAKPSLRKRIPKPDGRERLLGIASLEDKVVQKALLWVLQSVYEQDFVGFSYGFRPGRRPHDALDALSVAITRKKVNWILDADIETDACEAEGHQREPAQAETPTAWRNGPLAQTSGSWLAWLPCRPEQQSELVPFCRRGHKAVAGDNS